MDMPRNQLDLMYYKSIVSVLYLRDTANVIRKISYTSLEVRQDIVYYTVGFVISVRDS